MTEYSLAGGLVVVLTIVALSLLGGQVNNIFASMVPKSGNAQTTATTTGNTAGSPTGGSTTSTFPMTITLNNGKQLMVDMPTSLKDSVATSGVNGSTSALLADFKSVTDQMLASGDLTPEQASSLAALANQGYRIAQIESLIEQVAQTAADGASFKATPVQFDGQTMTILQLNSLIGSVPSEPATFTDPLSTAASSNQETLNFINLYNTALSSGALSNPQLQAYVGLLATEISYLSEVTEDAVATTPNTVDPCQYLPNFLASESTYLDSTNICKAGAGKATGNTCK
ncbi:MAG TPA: hypothetical protein V6C52_11710 [Coleofasciculaceae cyanobacterium]|jgi:hypothetical protein